MTSKVLKVRRQNSQQFNCVCPAKQAPALVQVSHPDPFWNCDTVDFDKIAAEASKETTKGMTTTELAGSWIAVLGMFARDDNDATAAYSTHNERKAQIQGAWDRVTQLIKDSVAAVSGDIGPGRQRDGELDELDARIQGLGGSNTKDSSKDTTEGLGFLTKRIFQMFLGLALVFEALTLDRKEIEKTLRSLENSSQTKRKIFTLRLLLNTVQEVSLLTSGLLLEEKPMGLYWFLLLLEQQAGFLALVITENILIATAMGS
ncbi:hypothetical protein PSTG_06012 [Puccinia striiformis f. sp. tritici PST-78]|uniref:Uncharacterized protein n=1 Tax=Puccinia striiformis f. sp. tritici PST-78 TaxID=1165861 RepID=A0A0L0VMW4_9BASI|nr:hypothetical protein PSTG_06012 [Puccinia striiformis f. sp. tritici PST-78]